MSALIILAACSPESSQPTPVVIEGAAVDILESTLWEGEITLDRPTWVRSPAVLSIAAGTHISFLPGSGLWIDGQVDAEPGVTFEAVGAMLDANDGDGVQVPAEDNGVEVTMSDIIGNSGWAVNNARAVAGCYVAENHGVLGVDALEAGEADGQFDIDTEQMTGIDQVTTPALSPLGTGT